MLTFLRRALAASAGLATAFSVAAASTVIDASRTESDGSRTMHLSVEVPAPAGEVWQAMTTSEGWRSWAAPVAQVDFRLGGIIETSYDLASAPGAPGNIRNQIVAFLPQRMVAIRNVQAPPKTSFDVPAFQSLHTIVLIDAVSEARTRVAFVQPGYGSGEPWDTIYKHFAWGNAFTLDLLKTRFEVGPIDWKARFEQARKK